MREVVFWADNEREIETMRVIWMCIGKDRSKLQKDMNLLLLVFALNHCHVKGTTRR